MTADQREHTLDHLHKILYDDLALCGCGNPEDAYDLIHNLLNLAPFHDDPNAVRDLIGQPGAYHIVLSALTNADLIEHGGGIGGSWLTPKGEWCRAAMRGAEFDDLEPDGVPVGLPHDGEGVHGRVLARTGRRGGAAVSTDLVAFLRRMLDDDAAAARAASGGTVIGSRGNWTPSPAGDEWEAYRSPDDDEELLVALRPGLPRPPDVMSGLWGGVVAHAPDSADRDARSPMPAFEHAARHDPARVLAEVEADRELLREYEQLLRAHEAHKAHKAAGAALAADIDHEERTGRWEGAGDPGARQRALRREADYLPAMLHILERWARRKAAVHASRPDYDPAWAPGA